MAFDGWLYKQTHIITSGTTLTDYQIQFTIYNDESEGTSGGNTIDCHGRCNSDFSDIRFSVDDTTSLPYWIEYYETTPNNLAVVWVKIPSITTTTLTIYYGNTSATSESNGDSTFIFFDGFDDPTLNETKWSNNILTGTRTISNSVITFNNSTTSTYSKIIALTDTDSSNIITGIKYRATSLGIYSGTRAIIRASGTHIGFGIEISSPSAGSYQLVPLNENVAWGSNIQSITLSSWKYHEVRHANTNYLYYRLYSNGSWSSFAATLPSGSHLAIGGYCSNSPCIVEYDFVFQRVYAATEPTHSTYTDEEIIIPPVVAITLNVNPSSGNKPLTTTITTTLPTTLTNFELLYGDGQTYNNTTQSSFATTHTYTNFGTYTIYASGYDGVVFYEKYASVIVSNNSLTASFTKSQNNNIITFTDTSSGSPDEWYWTFGDGTHSYEKNPVHKYDSIPIIYSEQSIFAKTRSAYASSSPGLSLRNVILGSELSSNGDRFRIKLVGSYSESTVLSHVAIVERYGNSADGVTIPTEITFDSGGSGVTIPEGETNYIQSDWINFSLSTTKDYLIIMDVSFTTSTSNLQAYSGTSYQAWGESWNSQTLGSEIYQSSYCPMCFEIESHSEEIEPYTVTLYASNQQFNGLVTSTITVSSIVYEHAPIANFKPAILNIITSDIPYYVQFTNLSYPTTGCTYLWNFGDLNTSTSLNPSHSYAALGVYDVTLTVTNDYGYSSITYNDCIRIHNEAKIFKEKLNYTDLYSTFEIKVFSEFPTYSDKFYKAKVFTEISGHLQGEFPSSPGLDEYCNLSFYENINEYCETIYTSVTDYLKRNVISPVMSTLGFQKLKMKIWEENAHYDDSFNRE